MGIYDEWKEIFGKSLFDYLTDINNIQHKSIIDLIGCRQDEKWHPEGDVFVHTMESIRVMEALLKDRKDLDRESLLLGILCHDMGKPEVTELIEGRWFSNGHPGRLGPAERFLDDIDAPENIRKKVLVLAKEHDCHINKPNQKTVRRLLERLDGIVSLEELLLVIEADVKGRPPLENDIPENAILIVEIAKEMEANKKPPKILEGRDFMALGYEPGKLLGDVVKRAYEAQLNNEFSDRDGGLIWAKAQMV